MFDDRPSEERGAILLREGFWGNLNTLLHKINENDMLIVGPGGSDDNNWGRNSNQVSFLWKKNDYVYKASLAGDILGKVTDSKFKVR